MKRNHFWRVAFCIDAKPAGSMLVICPAAELAISRAAQTIKKETGKYIEIMSCGKIFFSLEEEINFFQAVNQHGIDALLYAPIS